MDQQAVRRLLRVVLTAQDFPGRIELLEQVDHVEATGTMTWIDLYVDREAPRSGATANPVSSCCWTADDQGHVVGSLVLWTNDGYLSHLEHPWVTDEPPTTLPDAAKVRCDEESIRQLLPPR